MFYCLCSVRLAMKQFAGGSDYAGPLIMRLNGEKARSSQSKRRRKNMRINKRGHAALTPFVEMNYLSDGVPRAGAPQSGIQYYFLVKLSLKIRLLHVLKKYLGIMHCLCSDNGAQCRGSTASDADSRMGTTTSQGSDLRRANSQQE